MPDGLLNIDKPAGMTSHDVVARVRRALKTKRAGHAGTLDPDATGVLVVAVGQATRLLPHLPLEPKEYVARAAFGVATHTEDASGTVTAEADASGLTEDALRAALPGFVGEIPQVPPMVSAVHHQGRRLYELAREGVTVEREARTVTVHAIEMTDFAPGAVAEATLRVVCGGGTYIRTLCADVAAALGLPGHMKSLVREAVGPFRRADALPLDALESEGAARIVPMERALPSALPTRAVDDAEAGRIHQGQGIPAEADALRGTGGEVALLHRDRLLALARYDDGERPLCRPFKVFAE
ncbi:MAG TPA: tRNA pseudouridine(55) synthase TruB [Armatimonadaceae bacterium]|nr:tRNA pseudouridine(55) synthase TruB [Armatimonadaceae bacterium]